MSLHKNPPRAFTLVEMLVVIAIIGVLVALLLPAVNSAINSARRARMALEISQLDNGIEAYKNKFGDYPPGFRSHDVFIRHVRRCYPKISATHLADAEKKIWGDPVDYTKAPQIDEGEALVFWLSKINTDPRQPFTFLTTGACASPVALQDFDQKRLIDSSSDGGDGDLNASFRPAYAEQSCYIYIDSRAYTSHDSSSDPAATAEGGTTAGQTRAYHAVGSTSSAPIFINPTKFQIICAGQDGNFGTAAAGTIKIFPTGTGYSPEDQDNLANFSGGRRLSDSIPD